MKLKTLKAVGGFYRNNFNLYPISQYDLGSFDWIANDFNHRVHMGGIEWIGDRVLSISKGINCDPNRKLEEIIIQDGLIVFCDINRSWQVAFATDFERYMKWLRSDGHALVADQYEKALSKEKSHEPRIQDED